MYIIVLDRGLVHVRIHWAHLRALVNLVIQEVVSSALILMNAIPMAEQTIALLFHQACARIRRVRLLAGVALVSVVTGSSVPIMTSVTSAYTTA